jgi:hypothetical protein
VEEVVVHSFSISCISPQIASECNGSPISISDAKALNGPETIAWVAVPTRAKPIHLESGPKQGLTCLEAVSNSCSAATYVDIYLDGM